MGRLDLDQNWPLPPYSPRQAALESDASQDASAQPPLARAGEGAANLDEETLANALREALSVRPGADDAPRAPDEAAAQLSDRRDAGGRSAVPFLWGGLGFAAGLIASHLIGFWAFVAEVVLRDHGSGLTQVERSASLTDRVQKIVVDPPQASPATGTAGPLRCVALGIDRAAGETLTHSCEGHEATLRDAGFRPRGDRVTVRPRLQDPAAWSNSTAVQSTLESEIETGSLKASDVNVNLSLDR